LRKHQDYTPREKSIIGKALEFSARHYEDRLHKSGRPFLVHVIDIAENLLDIHADPSVIILALVHDLPHHTEITYADIAETFSAAMAELTRHVQKMGRMRTENESLQQQDLTYMLSSMSLDIRIAIIRLIHRLNDLRNQTVTGPDDLLFLATETIDLYVPLAGRLGMSMIKNELEDLCFKIISPDLHQEIQTQLARTREEDLAYLDHIKASLRQLLQKQKIKATINGRIKSTYSIYRKMMKRKIPLDKVYDKLAIRIVVNSVTQCYQILGIIHTNFTPIQGTFDDYIATPKSNNYQSLHTAIYPGQGIAFKPIEIQIRTEWMNQDAEFGAASHWRYKDQEFLDVDSTEEQKHWIKSLIKLREKFERHAEFVQALKSEVFEENVIIFDHLGKVIYLPAKATAKDYADYVNAPIHREPVVVRVNGRICALSQSLKSGDTIEICPIGKDNDRHLCPPELVHGDIQSGSIKIIRSQRKHSVKTSKGGIHYEER